MASLLARILSSTRSTLFSTSGRAVTHSRFFNSKAFSFYSTSDIRNIDFVLTGNSVLLSPNLDVFHIRGMEAFSHIGRNDLSKEIVDDNSDKSNLFKGRLRKVEVKETAEGVHLRVVVPGYQLYIRDLNVFVEVNTDLEVGEDTLIIECKSRDDPADDHEYVLEKLSFKLRKRLFQSDAISVKIDNFGLKVFVPNIHAKARKVNYWTAKFLHVNVVDEKEEPTELSHLHKYMDDED